LFIITVGLGYLIWLFCRSMTNCYIRHVIT
jgi:hypothetical protein